MHAGQEFWLQVSQLVYQFLGVAAMREIVQLCAKRLAAGEHVFTDQDLSNNACMPGETRYLACGIS